MTRRLLLGTLIGAAIGKPSEPTWGPWGESGPIPFKEWAPWTIVDPMCMDPRILARITDWPEPWIISSSLGSTSGSAEAGIT